MGIKNIGTLVTAAIRPNNSDDKIASAYAIEIKGGLHSYATKIERDAIIVERRAWGMLANVYNDGVNNATWQLKYGYFNTTISDNRNWVKFTGSTSAGVGFWIDPVKSVESNQPASPADGDRYILGPSPTGVVWSSLTEDIVVQWDSNTSQWIQYSPSDGMSVRILNQPNSIYRYDGNTSNWVRENVNQVINITATSSNAITYTGYDTKLLSYTQDSLYIVQFATANSGATMSLNINGLGARSVKQQTNAGIADFTGKDVSVNVKYSMIYDGVYFRLNKPKSDPTFVKYHILPDETVIVPAYQQYLVYGNLEVEGTLNVDPLGKVVVMNGALNVNGGTVSNSSNVQLVTLATTTNGLNVRKFSTTLSMAAGVAYNIVHNLDSNDITVTAWDETTYQVIILDVDRGSSNDITVTSISSLTNVRIVIMG